MTICNVLRDRITLFESLRSPYNKNYIAEWENHEIGTIVKELPFNCINNLYLPDPCEYIDANENDDFVNYINLLNNMI